MILKPVRTRDVAIEHMLFMYYSIPTTRRL
jgi:hypothetical protein